MMVEDFLHGQILLRLLTTDSGCSVMLLLLAVSQAREYAIWHVRKDRDKTYRISVGEISFRLRINTHVGVQGINNTIFRG